MRVDLELSERGIHYFLLHFNLVGQLGLRYELGGLLRGALVLRLFVVGGHCLLVAALAAWFGALAATWLIALIAGLLAIPRGMFALAWLLRVVEVLILLFLYNL